MPTYITAKPIDNWCCQRVLVDQRLVEHDIAYPQISCSRVV